MSDNLELFFLKLANKCRSELSKTPYDDDVKRRALKAKIRKFDRRAVHYKDVEGEFEAMRDSCNW